MNTSRIGSPSITAPVPEWTTRLSYSIGLVLALSLAMLRVCHAVMPWWFHGPSDYDRGVHDPALWAALYGYLLFVGVGPALVGLGAGLFAVRRGRNSWGWIGVVLNAGFVGVSFHLYGVLLRDGFFSFVLSAMPRFLEVGT